MGTGVTRLNCCGVPYWANRKLLPPEFIVNGVHFSNIYISPQFKVRPSAADVQSVIDYAAKKYRIDPTRIYVTGLSMGGGSTFDYSVVYGQNVAAIVPVCGGTQPTTALAQSIASKNLPVWGLYSDADQVVPVQWGKDWISWITTANAANAVNVKLTVWSGLSHNSTWGKAFNPLTVVDGYNIYQWMLRYKRTTGTVTAPPPPTAPPPTTPPPTTPPPVTTGNQAPVANAGLDRTLSLASGIKQVLLNGTLSKDSDGWLTKYEWTTVSGPSTTLVYKSPGQSYATGLVAGTYVFRMTVTDNKSAAAYDDVTMTVVN